MGCRRLLEALRHKRGRACASCASVWLGVHAVQLEPVSAMIMCDVCKRQQNTLKNSGYVGSDNEIASPGYFIPYDGVNGPDDGHKWLQGHPFY